MIKRCKECGKEFEASGTAEYCNDVHYRSCEVCGKSFIWDHHAPKRCCSRKCSAMLRTRTILNTTKICKLCGKEFHPINNSAIYCPGPHYQACPVCGKPVEFKYPSDWLKCCSAECSNVLREQTVESRYGVKVSSQAQTVRHKLREAALLSEDRRKATIQAKYGEQYTNVAQIPNIRNKIRDKITEDSCKARTAATNMERYGRPFAMQVPELRSKQSRNSKHISTLETRLHSMLDMYGIEYETHHIIASDTLSHEYDVYIPKYKILVECDGVYWHSYLEDPDGKHVRDDYEDVRIALVPPDHILHVIVESKFETGLKQLQTLIQSMDANVLDYDTELFKWCRTVNFPYPQYSIDRMQSDLTKLINHDVDTYNPYCRLGNSIVTQYHHSVYTAHLQSRVSPYEAWQDDKLLKQCIANRLIYQNDVDPSKVLYGFNVSKIAPKVSVFNPVLAKYLVKKYMGEADTVFDPFSGFSGRMLGVCASGKHYIGSDIHQLHVQESNEIIQQFNLNAEVTCKDVLSYESTSEYDWLFTCPPYANKEIYGDETVFQDCDAWIDTVTQLFKCKGYMFVVDHTDMYSNYIVEDLPNSSHFGTNVEHVIYLKPEDLR